MLNPKVNIKHGREIKEYVSGGENYRIDEIVLAEGA